MLRIVHRISVLLATSVIAYAGPAEATPPGIPNKATAQSRLKNLTVANQGSVSGYSRDQFPHWITISGNCDTRETVLKRDGTSDGPGGCWWPADSAAGGANCLRRPAENAARLATMSPERAFPSPVGMAAVPPAHAMA
jgi:hypothetical protein